jgi:hypothetical protein
MQRASQPPSLPPLASGSLPLHAAAHTPVDLAAISNHRLLDRVHASWLDGHRDGRPPARLDPLDLPASVLPYVMLLRLDDDRRLTVTLAGSFVCALHGSELRGLSTDDFFAPEQAASVVEAAREVAASNRPGLASRSYVALSRRSWSYTRLLLPLAPDAEGRLRFFKVLDPESLQGSDQYAWVARSDTSGLPR